MILHSFFGHCAFRKLLLYQAKSDFCRISMSVRGQLQAARRAEQRSRQTSAPLAQQGRPIPRTQGSDYDQGDPQSPHSAAFRSLAVHHRNVGLVPSTLEGNRALSSAWGRR